jgi:murein L,D-transpeptidase YcbB/YkuD
VKIKMLAGAASAALMVPFVPAAAAWPQNAAIAQQPSDRAVAQFYASRPGALLWLKSGPDSSAARELIGVLKRAPLDGLSSGPALAARAETLLVRARTGDKQVLASADRLMSTAWVLYVQALQQPPEGMEFADGWARPRPRSTREILPLAAAADSLAAHVRAVSTPNPVYAELRDAAWSQARSSGGLDPRVLANLERVRLAPFQKRYIIVDSGSDRLFMIEGGRIVDSMKVIVGKPSTQTPVLASTIYYATLNPYWNVPPDLVKRLTAPRVLEQGVGYLKSHNYRVMTAYSDGAQLLDPASVDWRAVANGSTTVAVRQLPGPGNSMGQVKFGFPNRYDVFLHDTPQKELFAEANRDISNGCIRVEDAERLGRWLLGREPRAESTEPEQHALLPSPVPVYITYLTANADGGLLTFLDDSYGLDGRRSSLIAAN